MPIKVIDILPPQKSKEIKVVLSKTPGKEAGGKRGRKKTVFFLFLIFLTVGIISYGQIFSKVKIEIWPEMETIELNSTITVSIKKEKADLTAKIIPGYLMEEQNFTTEQFFSSGKAIKENKAEGMIRVFNDYSVVSMPLRENTRFMAASGKIFRTPASVIIPGKKTEKGKETAGFIDIKVIADESGPDYNIEPTTFSIPGLVGTDSYTKVYGKSFEAMKGGFKGETPQVSEEDLKKAEISVVQKLKDEGERVLEKKSIDSDLIFLKDVFRQEIKSTSSSATVKTETEEFDFSGTVKSTALLFKKEEIMGLISGQLPSNKKIYEKTLTIGWDVKEADLNKGEATLDLKIKGDIYSDIETDLKKELERKSLSGVQLFLEQKVEIEKVKINSWPFWIKKTPGDPSKIEIKLNFNSNPE